MQHLQKKKLSFIIVVALLILMLSAVLLGGALLAARATPEIKQVPGLRQVTDVPVESIPLRHDLPDHPRGPPSETEEGDSP